VKILYVLQQSIYKEKPEPKWLIADSNINMAVGLISTILKKKSDWKFDVLIGRLGDFDDITTYDDILKHNNVRFIPFDFPVSAFINRQHFNAHAWKTLLENTEYDIIINCTPELSRNIRTLIGNMNYKNMPKLITQCFWMDCPEIGEQKVNREFSYDWRQFDGYECSDLCVFTCPSTKAAFFDNAKHKFNHKYLDAIGKKSVIWDFGFSSHEILEKSTITSKQIQEFKDKNKKRILFLNRLSGINYTHHLEFIDALKILKMQRDDFEVTFTNPSKKVNIEKFDVPNLVIENNGNPLTREQYWNLLMKASISVHLFTVERYGGCALRESIATGNIPVVANCFEQARIVEHPNLLVDLFGDSVSIDSLVAALNFALDTCDGTELDALLDTLYDNNVYSSFEYSALFAINNIEYLIGEK